MPISLGGSKLSRQRKSRASQWETSHPVRLLRLRSHKLNRQGEGSVCRAQRSGGRGERMSSEADRAIRGGKDIAMRVKEQDNFRHKHRVQLLDILASVCPPHTSSPDDQSQQ